MKPHVSQTPLVSVKAQILGVAQLATLRCTAKQCGAVSLRYHHALLSIPISSKLGRDGLGEAFTRRGVKEASWDWILGSEGAARRVQFTFPLVKYMEVMPNWRVALHPRYLAHTPYSL